MTAIRVQYDGYNGHFNLVDPSGVNLQDGEAYLVMDFASDAFDPDSTALFQQELPQA